MTEETMKARWAEASLIRDFVLRALDDRVATLRSAVNDNQHGQGTIDDTQRVLEALSWKAGRKDPAFEWLFNTTRDGEQLPETKAAAELIENSKDHKLLVGGYRYQISIDRKFLNRRKTSR